MAVLLKCLLKYTGQSKPKKLEDKKKDLKIVCIRGMTHIEKNKIYV